MKTKHIVMIVIVAIAIGVIISLSLNSSTYADFAQAKENPGKEFHIIGKLDTTKVIDYNTSGKASHLSFYLTDNKGQIRKVVYNNNKPQDFEKSESVVVIGHMVGDTLLASSMLLKCPSKYNDKKQPSSFKQKEYSTK